MGSNADPSSAPSPSKNGRAIPEVSLKHRWATALGVIAVGMIVTFPDPRAIVISPFYPLGFLYEIKDQIPGELYRFQVTRSDASAPMMVMSYAVFAAAVSFVVCSVREKTFFIAVLILCGVCAVTTKGCRKITHSLNQIH